MDYGKDLKKKAGKLGKGKEKKLGFLGGGLRETLELRSDPWPLPRHILISPSTVLHT